jgi:hypothetical protein
MSIDRLLKESNVNRDDVDLLVMAFKLALRDLHLVDRNDPVSDIVARKVIEIGTDGVREPQEIANRVIKVLGPA